MSKKVVRLFFTVSCHVVSKTVQYCLEKKQCRVEYSFLIPVYLVLILMKDNASSLVPRSDEGLRLCI